MRDSLSKARFEEIFRDGKRVRGEFCRISALPGSGRFGIATPRSLGCSARRNRLKRRMRAAVMQCGRSENLDVIVTAVASADKVEFEKIRNDLTSVLQKIKSRWENESASD